MRIRDKLSGAVWLYHFTPDDPEQYQARLDELLGGVGELLAYLTGCLEYMVLLEQEGDLYAVRCIHQGGPLTGPASNVALSYRGTSLHNILSTASQQARMLRERSAFYATAPKERWQVVA
jgi:hypothetical protein